MFTPQHVINALDSDLNRFAHQLALMEPDQRDKMLESVENEIGPRLVQMYQAGLDKAEKMVGPKLFKENFARPANMSRELVDEFSHALRKKVAKLQEHGVGHA